MGNFFRTPISNEVMTDIRAHATDGFNHWKENATEEQKAAAIADETRWRTDSSFKRGQYTATAAAFSAQGPNDAGLINEA